MQYPLDRNDYPVRNLRINRSSRNNYPFFLGVTFYHGSAQMISFVPVASLAVVTDIQHIEETHRGQDLEA